MWDTYKGDVYPRVVTLDFTRSQVVEMTAHSSRTPRLFCGSISASGGRLEAPTIREGQIPAVAGDALCGITAEVKDALQKGKPSEAMQAFYKTKTLPHVPKESEAYCTGIILHKLLGESGSNEFLRHFWSAVLPPRQNDYSASAKGTPARKAAKAQKMIGYLQKTHRGEHSRCIAHVLRKA